MSDFVPKEVVLQILSYLPVHTVIKCTLVCKSWHSLITSSCFIDAHLAKTLAKPLISQPILTRRFTESHKKEDYFLHSNGSLDTYQTINKCPLKAEDSNLFTRIVGTAGRVFGLTETGEVLLAVADRSQGGSENFDAFLSCFEATSGDMVLYDPKGRQTTRVVQRKAAIDAFYAGDFIESLVFLNKESGATSYEGAKIEEQGKSINSESGRSIKLDLEQIWSSMGLCSSNDADEEEKEHNSYAKQRM
ncbi:hypothetical protein COLO4_07288 [Corchorus olitorius]|uniref:F-box domain-containing protein n=1 Tax=Corchorus olitorius TaxID=93759 RepID=A0A1R3KK67_9ROSI|nr:hypothetical protein COLO4_07288 [Corchorus olitorius]